MWAFTKVVWLLSFESKTIKTVLCTILYINVLSPKIEQTKSKQTKIKLQNHLHIGPACAKVKETKNSKGISIVKAKSYETQLKWRWTKLLYARGEAERSDYKTNRKQDKHT